MEQKKGFISNLTLDTEITRDQAIAVFAALTGNCAKGTTDYFNAHPDELAAEKTTMRYILEHSPEGVHSERIASYFEKREQKAKE